MPVRSTALIALLLLCMLAAACRPAASSPAADPRPVRICYSATSPSQVVAWYAYEMGVFQDYGLAPELVQITTAPNINAALLTGEVHFCQSGGAGMVNAVAAGGDVALIMSYYNSILFDLVVGPDIQSPQDLVGRNIAVGTAFGLRATATRLLLEHVGLEPDSQVTLTQFTDQSEAVALAAIRSGTVAGYAMPPPLLAVHRADGLHVLVEGQQLDYHYQRLGLVTTRSFVQDNRDIALDVVRATLDAIARMKQDPQGVGAVLTKYMTLDPATDAADMAAMYETYVVRHLPDVPYPSESAMQAVIDEAAQGNAAAANVRPEQVIDASLLRELEDSGFIANLNR